MGNAKSMERKMIINAALQRYSEGASTEEEREILIESMKRYRAEAVDKEKTIPYNALVLRYFTDNPLTFLQIADRLHCTRRTVFKHLHSGNYYLAPHIFGIDGLYLIPPGEKNAEYREFDNTKRLLKNYRVFRNYIQGIDLGTEAAEDNPIEILEGTDGFALADDVLSFEVIKRNQQRTKAVLDYIDMAIKDYCSSCERSGMEIARRRHRIITAYYIDTEALSIEQLMEREQIKERSVYKDIQKAIGRLVCRIYPTRQHVQDEKGGEEDVLSNRRI